MLNEEENQAIKVLLDMNCNKIAGEEFTVNEKAYIGIAIGLINKLQKENEEKDKRIDLILNEQIQDGYLVNFNNLEEAREYYNKLAKEKEE